MANLITNPVDFNGSDIVEMLLVVNDWLVDGVETRACADMLVYAADKGLITTREHFAVRFPMGTQGYEVTNLGLEMLGKYLGDEVAREAQRIRDHYRENNAHDNWQAAAVKAGLLKPARLQ